MKHLLPCDTPPRPLFLEGRARALSGKKGFRGVFDAIKRLVFYKE